MTPIVYNLEPFGYSKNAIFIWQSNGYDYVKGSLIELVEFKNLERIEIIIVRLKNYIDSYLFDYLPNLKAVITATTGLDHIDLIALAERKIQLVSLRPHKAFLKTIPSTAEHTWALLLALVRNIPSSIKDVENGNWNRDVHRGNQLKNKNIGIIGLGRTGKKVAQYARTFGMNVFFYDPFVEYNRYVKLKSLHELARLVDIICLHVHLLPTTINLINKAFINNCHDGVYIINTSRGKVCDESALVHGLKNGKIKGIASDVLESELVSISQSLLWQALKSGENVIITPHIGGATWDAMWDCEEFLVNFFLRNY